MKSLKFESLPASAFNAPRATTTTEKIERIMIQVATKKCAGRSSQREGNAERHQVHQVKVNKSQVSRRIERLIEKEGEEKKG